VLEKFGNKVENIRVYVFDSGGGIPAAAEHLGVLRDACTLHSLDTAVQALIEGIYDARADPAAAEEAIEQFNEFVAEINAAAEDGSGEGSEDGGSF